MGLERFMGRCQSPVFGQLFRMRCIPFHQRAQPTPGKSPFDNSSFNFHGNLVFPILRMKMRRAVVIGKHVHHDTEKARQFRHTQPPNNFKHLIVCTKENVTEGLRDNPGKMPDSMKPVELFSGRVSKPCLPHSIAVPAWETDGFFPAGSRGGVSEFRQCESSILSAYGLGPGTELA